MSRSFPPLADANKPVCAGAINDLVHHALDNLDVLEMAFLENRLTIIIMIIKRAPPYRLNEKRRALFYYAV